MKTHPAATASDSICRLLYACFGLHSGFKRRRCLQRVTFVSWILVHIAGSLSTLRLWYGVLSDAETRSLSDYSTFGTDCIFIGTVIFLNVRLMVNHDEIESLIRRSGRPARQLLSQVVYAAPFGLICLRRGLYGTDAGTSPKEAYFALLELSTMAFFMACTDMVSNLKCAHENILALTAKIEANQEALVLLKWESRDRIRRINESFAWTWGAHCMLTYNTAVFVVVEMLGGHLNLLDKTISVMGDCFSLLRLYRLAEGSSSLRNSCLTVEAKIQNGFQKNELKRGESESLLPAMAYREDWDILLSGCFPLDSRRFLSFLATSVTCTAIVLQFDYHVLQNLLQVTAKP